jgi:hypothetical protein
MAGSIAERMSMMSSGHMAGDKKMGASRAGSEHSELHDHGDGTYHTVTPDGNETQHPHMGHALMHLAAHHGGGEGKHMHVHQDGMGNHTSHHVGEDGKVQGPHDHDNLEALKAHMSKFLDEEEQEGGGDYGKGGSDDSLFA